MLDMVVDRRELKDVITRILTVRRRSRRRRPAAAPVIRRVRELNTDPLDYLFSLERLGMKFGLENISRLCAALDHPERAFASIIDRRHQRQGLGHRDGPSRPAARPGHHAARYTSPHLERLEERFVIGDREVGHGTALRRAIDRVRGAIETLQRSGALSRPRRPSSSAPPPSPSICSARPGSRIAVLEVGLGGRLDATNVVQPDRSPRSRRSASTIRRSSATPWRRSPSRRPASSSRGVPVDRRRPSGGGPTGRLPAGLPRARRDADPRRRSAAT